MLSKPAGEQLHLFCYRCKKDVFGDRNLMQIVMDKMDSMMEKLDQNEKVWLLKLTKLCGRSWRED